jgi:predicted PurR-regulated permease PerM
MVEEKVNINGEFLGISSLAVYSAPWYLQIVLLVLVVALFLAKVSRDSKQLNRLAESDTSDKFDKFLSDVNRVFFGFSVPYKNLVAYWIGFLIYLVTLIYAGYNTYVHTFA